MPAAAIRSPATARCSQPTSLSRLTGRSWTRRLSRLGPSGLCGEGGPSAPRLRCGRPPARQRLLPRVQASARRRASGVPWCPSRWGPPGGGNAPVGETHTHDSRECETPGGGNSRIDELGRRVGHVPLDRAPTQRRRVGAAVPVRRAAPRIRALRGAPSWAPYEALWPRMAPPRSDAKRCRPDQADLWEKAVRIRLLLRWCAALRFSWSIFVA